METRYYEWGRQDKPVLVFLHGMGSAGLSVGELASLMKEEYHIISFDLPGHGGNDPLSREEDYLPTKMAERIHGMLDPWQFEKVFLMGHSWGAHLALYVAALFPERIKGLILLDGGYLQKAPSGDSLQQELTHIDTYMEAIRYPSFEDFLESEKAESPRWSREIEEGRLAQVSEMDGEVRLAVSPFTAKSVLKGIYQEPTASIFFEVQAPILLLRSTLPKEVENERLQAIDDLMRAIHPIEVQAIPNTSHDIYRDAPVEVISRIKDWILERL